MPARSIWLILRRGFFAGGALIRTEVDARATPGRASRHAASAAPAVCRWREPARPPDKHDDGFADEREEPFFAAADFQFIFKRLLLMP